MHYFSLFTAISLFAPWGLQDSKAIDHLIAQHAGPFTIPWLQNLLNSDDDMTEAYAASAFASLGVEARSAIPFLVNALRHKDPHIRVAILDAIGNCPAEASSSIEILLELLNDESSAVRRSAAITVARLAPKSADVAHRLCLLLRTEQDAEVREAISLAIGSMASAAKLAICQLQSVARLNDPAGIDERVDELMVRIQAAASLCRINGDSRVVPWLIAIIRNERLFYVIREAAVDALGQIGERSMRAVPYLCDAVRFWRASGEHIVGPAAIRALGNIGECPELVFLTLKPLVKDPYGLNGYPDYFALWSLEAIASCRPITWETQECLERALEYRDNRARLVAARALVRSGITNSRILDVLIEILNSPPPPFAETWEFEWKLIAASESRDTASLLGEMGSVAGRAIPTLLHIVQRSEFETVRDAARKAITRIQACR